ncbi:M23 family metallopeptidase [Haliea sp. E1-2-M8]|uniref:M23 family metallopeptidase n=1 Tax=Haliea sp. E1-2-M8 TaxID=3064706 RepID=UPI00271ADBCD|nr:M23 family metallopeptidase [Haliea sp. E1-2-M8]MDO8862143.1 M23 family metallopeptidase [Haliea sp. E1-2-M8]
MTNTLKTLLAGAAMVCLPLNAAAACIELQGQLQQGGLVWGQAAAGSTVSLDGQTLDVLADGTFLAGFGRNAARAAELVVGDCRQNLAVASREYNIQRVEGVPQQTVTPPPEVLERIARERELVSAAKARRLARPDLLADALAGFSWPVQGRISGVYGSQRVYNGTPGNPHYGVDVAVPTGTIVRAPTAGVVTLAEPDLFYSGGTIILDHGYRLSSSFLHLSKVRVAVGDEVQAGDIIGEVGATGRATGPHLDWRMAWRNERVDPQFLVPPMPQPAAAHGS